MSTMNKLLALGTGYLGGTTAGRDQGLANQMQMQQLMQGNRQLQQNQGYLDLQRDQHGLNVDKFDLTLADRESMEQVMRSWQQGQAHIEGLIDKTQDPDMYLAQVLDLFNSDPAYARFLPEGIATNLQTMSDQIGAGPKYKYMNVDGQLVKINLTDNTEEVVLDARGMDPNTAKLRLLDIYGGDDEDATFQHAQMYPDLYKQPEPAPGTAPLSEGVQAQFAELGLPIPEGMSEEEAIGILEIVRDKQRKSLILDPDALRFSQAQGLGQYALPPGQRHAPSLAHPLVPSPADSLPPRRFNRFLDALER